MTRENELSKKTEEKWFEEIFFHNTSSFPEGTSGRAMMYATVETWADHCYLCENDGYIPNEDTMVERKYGFRSDVQNPDITLEDISTKYFTKDIKEENHQKLMEMLSIAREGMFEDQ